MVDYWAKISYNKTTGQPTVFLSKKKLLILKNQKAKYLKVRGCDIK